jgi:lipoate-protein ligase A
MELLDLTLESAEANLALDDALLAEAEAGGSQVLRLWEQPQPAVILGSSCRLAADVREAHCQADGVPIFRRASGGGTVLLGPGCLCFSLILRMDQPELKEVRSSYCSILGKLAEALSPLVPDVTCAGTSDLAVGGMKFSGNAQWRRRSHLLHHGTVLFDFDLEQFARYLFVPARQPDYRRERSHRDFVMNLPVTRKALWAALIQAWQADRPRQDWPMEEVLRLVREKYSQPAWIRRR